MADEEKTEICNPFSFSKFLQQKCEEIDRKENDRNSDISSKQFFNILIIYQSSEQTFLLDFYTLLTAHGASKKKKKKMLFAFEARYLLALFAYIRTYHTTI